MKIPFEQFKLAQSVEVDDESKAVLVDGTPLLFHTTTDGFRRGVDGQGLDVIWVGIVLDPDSK